MCCAQSRGLSHKGLPAMHPWGSPSGWSSYLDTLDMDIIHIFQIEICNVNNMVYNLIKILSFINFNIFRINGAHFFQTYKFIYFNYIFFFVHPKFFFDSQLLPHHPPPHSTLPPSPILYFQIITLSYLVRLLLNRINCKYNHILV